MKPILTAFLLCVALMVHGQDETTCEKSCTCRNNLTPAGVMMSHIHDKHEWMVSYRYMNMQMKDLLNGSSSINKEEVFSKYIMSPERMTMNMHMLMLMYGITDRLTVMSMVNYSMNYMEMSMFSSESHNHNGTGNSHAHQMQTAGFNDLKIYLAYGLLKKETSQLSLFTGANLPTGNIYCRGSSNDAFYAMKRLPYSMQLGSGSFDFMSSLNYLYQKDRLACSVQLGGTLHPWYNAVGYKPGNETTFNTWLAYKWTSCISTSVRAEASISGKIKGFDPSVFYYNEPSANPRNYGGRKILLFAGSVFQMKRGYFKNHRFGVEYGLPVYQSVNGIQMKLNQTINASWAINF